MIWVGSHPTFSRQSKANKFTLVFWLNENVGFAFVLSMMIFVCTRHNNYASLMFCSHLNENSRHGIV